MKQLAPSAVKLSRTGEALALIASGPQSTVHVAKAMRLTRKTAAKAIHWLAATGQVERIDGRGSGQLATWRATGVKFDPPPRVTAWPAEDIATLMRLWTVDELTVRGCAQSMGRTPGAIIGMVSRLGFTGRAAQKQAEIAARPPKPPRVPREAKPRAPRVPRHPKKPAVILTPVEGFRPTRRTTADDLPPRAVVSQSVWAPLPDTIPTDLLDLKSRQCRWPVDLAGETLFCAEPKHGDSSYCRTHKAWSKAAGVPRFLARATDHLMAAE